MKKLFFLIIALVLFGRGTAFSQVPLEKFIIGGLIVNPSDSYNSVFTLPWRTAYFDTAKSFGLNYAEYTIMEDSARIPSPLDSLGVSMQDIRDLLSSMQNAGIKSRLNTFAIFDNWTERMPYARRWVFQVEQDSGFTSTYKGVSDHLDSAKSHYHLAGEEEPINIRILSVPDDDAGVVCNGVRIPSAPGFTITDGANYHVKVRAKLESLTAQNDSTPVLTVKVTNLQTSISIIDTLYAFEFSNTLKEIKSLSFYKQYPSNPPPPDTTDKIYEFIDKFNRTGSPDYILKNTGTTPYDIELYWFGTKNCWIDYVAVDDSSANVLYSGGYDDTVIEPTVNGYADHPGLGSFSVWDEPFAPNYYPVGYVNEKIEKLLLGTPYEDKIGMAFDAATSWSSKKFLHETQQDMHLADVYQFHGWTTRPDVTGNIGYNRYHSTIFGTGQSGGTDGVQAIYDKVYEYVNHMASSSRSFEKEYVVALQGHSWRIGDDTLYFQYLREPSLYEMIAQANIAIGVGAHGIMWNKYSPTEYWETVASRKLYSVGILDSVTRGSTPHQFIPRYTDAYGLPKWEGLKSYHKYVKKIGPALLKLIPTSATRLHLENIPGNQVVNQIQSGHVVDEAFIPFPDSSNYVQCTFFEEKYDSGNGSRYIHIVNRRTHNTDTNVVISLKFNNIGNYNNWRVEELGTDNIYHVQANGYLRAKYSPGEGKLLRAIPVTKIGYGTYKTSETINEVVTVPSGKTLNIEKGVTLNFGNAGRFVSNGTLNINGAVNDSVSLVFDSTAFTSYNTGVRINGGAATIKYAKIKNAYYGVRVLNNAHVTMYGSRLYNNYAGVLLEDNIYSETPYPSTIDSCLIHSNTEGIYFHNGIAYLMKNRITDNYGNGILLTTGAYGNIVGVDGVGKNKILNNANGIHTEDYSIVMVGHDWYQDNYNTVDSNNLDLLAEGKSTIEAAYVWWGDDRPTIEYELDPGAYINFDNHLVSPPPDARSIDPIGHDHGYASEGTVSQMRDQQATDDINTRMGFDPAVTSTPVEGTNLNKLLNEARKYFRSGNYYAGAEICKAVIDSNKNDKVSVRALNLLSAESQIHHRVEFRAYIEQLNRVPGMTKIDSYVGLIDAKLDPKKYESKIDALIAKYNKKDELLMYLYDKFVHCLLNKEKPDQAIAVYGEMVQRFPKSKLTQIAYRMLNPVQFSVSQNLMSTENAQVPKEYGISNNYPNPFNPETSIDYAIPYPSNVVIELYGVTGEKVRTLVQNDHTPGYYTYRLTNISGMASGIYFYRIAATNLQTGKVYTTVRKMTLMK